MVKSPLICQVEGEFTTFIDSTFTELKFHAGAEPAEADTPWQPGPLLLTLRSQQDKIQVITSTLVNPKRLLKIQ